MKNKFANREMVFLNLPGWASSPKIFTSQYKFSSSVRIINDYYFRGFDGMTITQERRSTYGEAVSRLIKNEMNPVLVVGWSLGAMVALELALLAPQKVLGLVLVGGTARFTNEGDYNAGLPKVVVERMKKKLARNLDGTLQDFQSLMFTAKEREAGFLKSYQQTLTSEMPWSQIELKVGLDYLIEQDLREKLENIHVPTLIIHGDKDEICPVNAAHYLHANIEGSVLKLLSGCGHVPFISKKQDYYNEVGGWLDDQYR